MKKIILLLLLFSSCQENQPEIFKDPNTNKIEITEIKNIQVFDRLEKTNVESMEGYRFCLNVISFTDANIDSDLIASIQDFNDKVYSQFSLYLKDSLVTISDTIIGFKEHNDDWHSSRVINKMIVDKYTEVGCINIAVFKQKDMFEFYMDKESESIDVGLTPVPLNSQKLCESWSPIFDWSYIADVGFKGNTFSHEIGHFFGLGEVFYHSRKELKHLGVTDANTYVNNDMNYGGCYDGFTPSQIEMMTYIAYTDRKYLMH